MTGLLLEPCSCTLDRVHRKHKTGLDSIREFIEVRKVVLLIRFPIVLSNRVHKVHKAVLLLKFTICSIK
jgi:hypothetical protein